jgi:ribonuclease HII
MVDSRVPSLAEEKLLIRQGFKFIAGIDEVGRGALAGPVMAAAVIMPPGLRASWKKKVRDSKLLTPEQREALYEPIRNAAVAVAIGSVDCFTIDAIGIARATQIAMLQAINQLSPPADSLLIDYFTIPDVTLPQKGVVNGDTLCFSIACASIIAKVTRDRMMIEFDEQFPGYLFAHHKGYSTEEHVSCLNKLGPCPIHRRAYQPVMDAMGGGETANT